MKANLCDKYWGCHHDTKAISDAIGAAFEIIADWLVSSFISLDTPKLLELGVEGLICPDDQGRTLAGVHTISQERDAVKIQGCVHNLQPNRAQTCALSISHVRLAYTESHSRCIS